jgi:hypothetical protein
MKPAAWRVLILTLCAVTAFSGVAQIIGVTGAGGVPPWYGLWGSLLGPSSRPYSIEVHGVDPGGPTDRAGLRDGDLIDIRANDLVERFSFFGQPLNGRPILLSIRRGPLQTRATVVPGPADLTQQRWALIYLASDLGVLWLALFAALIAWRRAYAPGNLLLSTVLVFVAIGIVTFSGYFAAPSAWVYVVLSIFYLALPASVALWAAFTGSFAQPLSRARRIAQWLCYALVAAALTMGAAQIVGIITLWFDPVSFMVPALLIQVAAIFAALICSALAFTASRGVDRQRVAWSLIPLACLYCALQSEVFLPKSSVSYATAIFWLCIDSIAIFGTPVVLTYVALNRRLIDIGFVLNRTVVFAIVSAIVIGAFILVEWAASALLAGTAHATSAVIGMIVALGLGLSLRYIHKYVDRFVDRVFFWKRHEDEAALRRFAHESSYITERSLLLERTLRTVKEHTDADDVAILVCNGAAYVSASDGERVTVSENDPTIVALRAWNHPVDLHDVKDSEVRGEFAFPMVSRGALVGVLICGPKRDGEVYAPDESDALLALAHSVGTALDTLSSRTDGAVESVRETLQLIVERLDALPNKLGGRP